MAWIGVRGFVLVCAMALVAAPAVAQIGAGALTGEIADRDSGALPGVAVTVTAVGTNRARTVVTDGTGAYYVPGLPPGVYRVHVELSGFRPITHAGVRITTGETVRLTVAGAEFPVVSEA